MNGMTNSLPKSSSQTSITPRLPTSPRVSPLPKNRNRWWSQTRASVESSPSCRSKMVQRLMRNSGPKLSTQYVDDPLLSEGEGEGEGGRGREHGHHVAIRAPIDIFF